MKLASTDGNSFLETQQFRLFRLYKRAYQAIKYRRGQPKGVLFIVGCQRSGTSLMSHILRRDLDVVTYDEVSPLSDGDMKQGLVLNPLPQVRERIMADRAPLVVAKPLVNSQDVARLLEFFPEARVVWMYRHYADVAASNANFFGPDMGRQDLQPILANDQTSWKAAHLSPEARATIVDLSREMQYPQDAAALFWYARNSHHQHQGLSTHARVRLCRYDDLVSDPAGVVRRLYQFLERPHPGDGITSDVFATSSGRGRALPFSPSVQQCCEEMLIRLDAAPRI